MLGAESFRTLHGQEPVQIGVQLVHAPSLEVKSLDLKLLVFELYSEKYLDVKRLLLETSLVPRPRSQPTPDHVDRFLEEFKEEFPAEIDLEIEGIVDRINGINRRLKRALDETLAEYGLSHAAHKVLSSLRWAGAPYRRSAGELAELSDLSSGAMTSRLDQLEEAGLVRRLRDPDDRRGVLVEPTEKGKKLWEKAMGVQARKEQLIAAALNEREQAELNALLRRIMRVFEEREAEAKGS
jgi:DNA-binding MarR family transcriptional regulator